MKISSLQITPQLILIVLILIFCLCHITQNQDDIAISMGFRTLDQIDGAYPVLWCEDISKNYNISYEITSTSLGEIHTFEPGDCITCRIGDLPDRVNSGFHANLVSDFQLNGTSISSKLVAPLVVPYKIFRACCNAYKSLTFQLKDWGWKNFTLLTEKPNEFILSYTTYSLNASISYNREGIARSFNATLQNFSYSADLVTPIEKSTNSAQATPWYFIVNLLGLFLFILNRRRFLYG